MNGRTPQLRCTECGAVAAAMRHDCRCPQCGDLLEVGYRGPASAPDALRRVWLERRMSLAPEDQSGVWRYREMLPGLADADHIVTLREGNTPLYAMPRCGRALGLERLLAKHQGLNPTGSFKDTGMTVAVSRARAEGCAWVACASTGNTSAAMAAYAARAGLRSLVLVPEGKVSSGKLAQALDYGALTCQLPTDFDGCVRVLNELLDRAPVYLVNSVNPYRLEGQKTAAFELLEQLEWEVPDHLIVPGGNLANGSALGKGLIEMLEAGLIGRLPQVTIVQAEGANPMARWWRRRAGDLVPVAAETRATAIRIGHPASWKKAARVLERTGGACVDVSEEQIASAKAQIGAEGIGCEPASAATLAGAAKLARAGFIAPGQTVVLILTGHLLKDPDYTLGYHQGLPGGGLAAEANAEAILRLMAERERIEGREAP